MKRNCHIRGFETDNDNVAISTYGFTYDTQGRLTSSDRYNGAATAATQLYTERNISYDRNGNILTLKRISNSIPNPLHNFTYSYDGDKLSSLTRWVGDVAMNTPYSYDGNGNMTFDGDQQMKLCYDINNLLHDVKKVINTQSSEQEDLTAVYSYFVDGTKYFIKDTEGNSRIYIGPFTLTRKEYTSAMMGDVSGVTILESADAIGSDARFAFASTPKTISGTDTTYTIAYETLYLLKDHLGSIRTITDSQGNILEKNDYYPYGLQTDLGRNYPALPDKYRMRMPTYFTAFGQNGNAYPTVSSPTGKMQPFRLLYNGKELQMVAQTRFVDYGARMLDPVIARWNGMDPMAEKYLSMTSYSYCAGNPIRNTDIEGLLIDDYYDYLTGRYLGTDGASTNNMRIIREDVFRNIVEKNGGQSASKEATLELQDSENSKIITVDYEKINKDILAIADNSFETKIENALYLVLDRENAVLTSELSSNKGNTNNSSYINGDWAESTKILRRGNNIIVIAQIHGHPESTSELITNSGVSDLDVSGAQKNLIPVYAVDAMRKRKGKQVPIHRANPDGTKDNNIGYTCGEGKFKEFDIARDAMNRR